MKYLFPTFWNGFFFSFSLNFCFKYPTCVLWHLGLSMWSLFSLHDFSAWYWNNETFSHLIFIQWNDSHGMSLSFHCLYCHQYGINQLDTIEVPISARRSAVILKIPSFYTLQRWPLKLCYLNASELNIFFTSTFLSLVIAHVEKSHDINPCRILFR